MNESILRSKIYGKVPSFIHCPKSHKDLRLHFQINSRDRKFLGKGLLYCLIYCFKCKKLYFVIRAIPKEYEIEYEDKQSIKNSLTLHGFKRQIDKPMITEYRDIFSDNLSDEKIESLFNKWPNEAL